MTACDNPLLTITDFVDYAAVRPEHVTPAVTALAEDVEKTLLQVLDASRPATWENVVEPLNESLGRLTRAWGVVGHLQSVCDTPELRRRLQPGTPACLGTPSSHFARHASL